MNLPTQHQLATAATHVATSAATVIATLGFVHVLSAVDVGNATTAISQIGDGVAKIMSGVGTLLAIGSALVATIRSGPFASMFRAADTISKDPAMMAQLQTTPLAQQAQLVTIADKLPGVDNVGTKATPEGRDLANSVPSPTVQSVSPQMKANLK